jgi:hypothetical protein
MYARPERPVRRAKRIALEGARRQGCVCDAEVYVIGVSGDAAITTIGHDSWCPLLRAHEDGTGAPAWDFVFAPKGSVSGDAA